MKPAITRPNVKTKDTIARWISFLALAALLAMATLPGSSSQRDTAGNSTHWSNTWHG